MAMGLFLLFCSYAVVLPYVGGEFFGVVQRLLGIDQVIVFCNLLKGQRRGWQWAGLCAIQAKAVQRGVRGVGGGLVFSAG